jgi:hypothetical protein
MVFIRKTLGIYIPYSHYVEYPGPTTKKHTTFANQGRDIPHSVNMGYQIPTMFLTSKPSRSRVGNPDLRKNFSPDPVPDQDPY